MKNTEYQKLKKGDEVYPLREMLTKFPEARGCRYFLVSTPRKSYFPRVAELHKVQLPLSLRRKGFKSIERWSGLWFKVKK